MSPSDRVVDPDQLWALFRAVITGGDRAWPALASALEPTIVAMARHQPIGRLRDLEDSSREIVTRVLDRLHARDHAAIRKLCALDPPPELQAWLRVLARRSAIDMLREHPEFDRGGAARAPGWISLASLTSGALAPDPSSLEQKKSEVIAFVRASVERAAAAQRAAGEDGLGQLALEWRIAKVHVRRLIKHGDQYLAVLSLVLAGHSYVETAAQLGGTRREVELAVRRIEELLRARGFGAPAA
jgi:DNA-directed RNA polymerase specialized sigma24 family protein